MEKTALVNFVNEFTTVSTNVNKVGQDVSAFADDVDKDKHMKSCRKYDGECRFQFPRYPSVRMIIATPFYGMSESEKNMMLKEQKIVLKKVGETNDDIVKGMIEAIGDSNEESLESYKVNKKQRIEAIL